MCNISVFIPLYNAEPFIESTIQSVLDQSYQLFEIIILDDCSTDASYEIALAMAASNDKIKVYKNEANLGMLENWNKGISLCENPYFVKLDADDLWEPTFLEKSIKVLENNSTVGLVFTDYIKINEEGITINESPKPLPNFAKDKKFSCIPLVELGPDKMLSFPVLQQGVSVMRKVVFDTVGKYRYLITKETQAATDTEFYFRVGAHFDIFCIDETLYNYRVHKKSISATDKGSMISELKLYESKRCIIEYYTSNGFLDQSIAKKYLRDLEISFQFSRIAYFKNTNQTLAFFKLLAKTTLFNPQGTFRFYKGRLIDRIR